MHTKGILHRDIKSDNIFCNSEGEIKIADLGLSVCLTKDQAYRKTRAGSNNWISPEIVEGKIYSSEIDVWSFGAFIFELGKGEPPFNQFKQEESLFEAIANIDQRPFRVVTRSAQYNDLLQKCMKVDPA